LTGDIVPALIRICLVYLNFVDLSTIPAFSCASDFSELYIADDREIIEVSALWGAEDPFLYFVSRLTLLPLFFRGLLNCVRLSRSSFLCSSLFLTPISSGIGLPFLIVGFLESFIVELQQQELMLISHAVLCCAVVPVVSILAPTPFSVLYYYYLL
jgi:type IV secretory pathway TrbL component